MTINELISKIAIRAGQLSMFSLTELRFVHPDNLDGSKRGVQWSGISRARLIEDILQEEFNYDDDIEL
jgi:hypothetical protein